MYRVLQLVGEGSFGRVYKAKNSVTGQIVALKCIAKVGLSKKELQNLKKEIEIMRGLNHPNIIQLFDSFQTETEVVIVTEFAESQLFQILKDNETLPESKVQMIACQLISALHYLHSHRILHRDMKTQNVLLMKNGVVKLCDFGLARAMSVSTLVLTSIKGTPLYMSPELMEEKPYDHTADLWSLGCILYELHTGMPPFNAQSIFHLLQCIVKDPVKWPDNMSDAFRSFLQGLLTKDPQKRLSWPHLLDHPFVAGDVLVLSDTNSSSTLTVTPTPDMVALKNQQAGAKALVNSGGSRSLQRAREQKKKSKKVKAVGRVGVKMKDGVKNGRTISVMTSESTSAMSQGRRDRNPISVMSLMAFFDADTKYWEELDRETDPSRQQRELSDHISITSQIKSKIMAFTTQLADGVVEEDIQKPLKVLRNLILSSDPEKWYLIGQNLELPHVLFHLVHNAVEKSSFLKQPWSVAALGEALIVLRVYWEKHRRWVKEEPKLEEFCKPFSIILSQPNLLALAPAAASILSLFIKHNVGVRVDTGNVAFLLKALLSGAYEPQVSLLPGWGVCDGLLYLLQHTLSENDSGSSRLDPVMLHLWKIIGASLAKATPHTDVCSTNGLHSFLSTTLSMYSQDPYSCVPLFSKCESKCVFTLGQLLGTDCLHLFATGGPEQLEVCVSHNSMSLLSCQLLCFPFSLDLPSHTMSTILQVYDSCDIATSLLQVIQTFPSHQLELPLSLLSHLLLCNLDRTVSRLEKAAHGFFASKPETPFSRSASSLLCDLLQRVEMWDSAVELLTLLSHVACSHGHSCIKLHLEASVLHQALVHSYCKVKAAACRLLGYLEPFRPVTSCPPQTDFFKHVIDSLHHPCVSVRRAACRTVVIWLRYIAVGDLAIEEGVDEEEKHRWTEDARRTVTMLKPLITDPDPLIRRHCCTALGNLLYINGAASLLLDEDITNILLKVACTDNHYAVRQAAIATLSLYLRCELTRQVLISLDAGRKFVEASQHAPAHCDYNQLIERL